jgi:hypothetical protein
MPKKRVGVSLRKPSPAPEAVPESADVAVDTVSTVSSQPEPSAAESVARAAEGAFLREATAGLEATTIEAFVNGAAAAIEKAASEMPAAKLEDMLRRGPEGYRELTIYLPEELALKLSVHCLERNVDLSRLVASAVERHLSGVAVEPHHTGEAPSKERAIALAARALLLDLADWVRTAWTTRRRGFASRIASVTAS